MASRPLSGKNVTLTSISVPAFSLRFVSSSGAAALEVGSLGASLFCLVSSTFPASYYADTLALDYVSVPAAGTGKGVTLLP
jgi:hypothetical protein